jgi:hypothetical protein
MPAGSSPICSRAPASTRSRPKILVDSIGYGLFESQDLQLKVYGRIAAHETIETIDEITRKNSPAIPIVIDTDTNAEEGVRK